jgi:hypothetical protein
MRYTAMTSLRSAINRLWEFIRSKHRRPNRVIKYPHLPRLDWTRAFPPDAVLAIRLSMQNWRN